jgi:uncharacterized protein YecE (DUF72 family)
VHSLRAGCSCWNYPHFRGIVYPRGLPERRWLERYATIFDTVEVNATFYRLPTRSAVAGWVEQTPDGFCFVVKASRYLTHVRRLQDLGPGVERFYDRLEPLVRSPKLGPVLWQLPATCRRDDERLASALARLRRFGTASSSGTRAGSRATSMRSCASRASRWSSATTRAGRSRRVS